MAFTSCCTGSLRQVAFFETGGVLWTRCLISVSNLGRDGVLKCVCIIWRETVLYIDFTDGLVHFRTLILYVSSSRKILQPKFRPICFYVAARRIRLVGRSATWSARLPSTAFEPDAGAHDASDVDSHHEKQAGRSRFG